MIDYSKCSKKDLAKLLLQRAPKLAVTGYVTDAPDAWLKHWTRQGLIIALQDLDERGIASL